MSGYLTIAEVAGTLGVSTKTVRRRIDAGALPCYRDGRVVRVPQAGLDEYIARRSVTLPQAVAIVGVPTASRHRRRAR